MGIWTKAWPILKVVFKLSFTIAALTWVVYNVDMSAVKTIWKNSDPLMLFAAFVAFFVSQIFASTRIRSYFLATGLKLSEWSNYKLYLLGMFYNMFLPGGVGGDGYKIYYLRKTHHADTRKLILATLLDKASGLWALCVISLVLLLKLPQLHIPSIWIWLLMIVGTIVYYLIYRIGFKSFLSSFVTTNVKAMGVQLCQVLSVVFTLYALGIKENHTPYLVLFMVSSLVALFPLTIGGLGARELVFMYGAEYYALDAQIGVAISLFFYVISALASLPGLYFVFYNKSLEDSPIVD